MCGIALLVCSDGYPESDQVWQSLKDAVSSRGPDARNEVEQLVQGYRVSTFGATLNLRGPTVNQPLQAEDGTQLLFNGEIFGGQPIVPEHENDGLHLLQHIQKQGIQSIAQVEGPFALIYIENDTISFCRDPQGRRSLLVHYPTESNPFFFLASAWPTIASLSEATPVEVQPGLLTRLQVPTLFQSESHRQSEALWPAISLKPDGQNDPTLALASLEETLTAAVSKRVRDLRSNTTTSPSSSRIAILFSGGLDCATLALLAHHCLPIEEPIDLLNVAFENPRVLAASKSTEKYNVPDRLTGRNTVEELRTLCPGRIWRFVEVNIGFEESVEKKAEVLGLMKPQNTVMDYSIGMALYFAAKGQGVFQTADGMQNYTSKANILLSGLGADELFGGYGRHRRAFEQSKGTEEDKWAALTKELEVDLARIGTRNLGRDDRCLSRFGKEARYPFLDEQVVQLVCSLATQVKCNPLLPDGTGDKILLRQLASKLGLAQASTYQKRALQFGSRSAKRENSKVSGVDIET